MAQVNEGADPPSVQAKTSEDATVQALRTDLNRQDMLISGLQGYGQQYRALMSAKATRDDMQRRLDDAISEVRARVTATILESFRQQKDITESQQKAIQEKVDSVKQD